MIWRSICIKLKNVYDAPFVFKPMLHDCALCFHLSFAAPTTMLCININNKIRYNNNGWSELSKLWSKWCSQNWKLRRCRRHRRLHSPKTRLWCVNDERKFQNDYVFPLSPYFNDFANRWVNADSRKKQNRKPCIVKTIFLVSKTLERFFSPISFVFCVCFSIFSVSSLSHYNDTIDRKECFWINWKCNVQSWLVLILSGFIVSS